MADVGEVETVQGGAAGAEGTGEQPFGEKAGSVFCGEESLRPAEAGSERNRRGLEQVDVMSLLKQCEKQGIEGGMEFGHGRCSELDDSIRKDENQRAHSHSMLAGGLVEMS